MKPRQGDWIQWYDYADGRYLYGLVINTGKVGRIHTAYTDHGAVDWDHITEIRRPGSLKQEEM